MQEIQDIRDIRDIREVFFIGIGGIGMSALARYFRERGASVSGYDKTPSALTSRLQAEGIDVSYTADTETIPRHPGLVVYTPAVPADHPALLYYREHGFPVLKRSEVLGLISAGMFCITVGGTHGKTTTSALIAHILRESGYGCNAFLGGIALNYGTNYWSDARSVAVIEADEYDRSFLKLEPDIAVLTAMDPDHLDIYGTEEAMREAYVSYTRQLKPGGILVCKSGLPTAGMGGDRKMTYSLGDEAADSHATGISEEKGAYRFGVETEGQLLDGLVLHAGGLHNVENAVAAVTVARQLHIPQDKIRSALASFAGIRRRFEYVLKTEQAVYIDDYAHHPEELRALLQGIRSLYPEVPPTVIFQPHLYSRTRDMAEAFARVLEGAGEVILLPVYPAREQPLPGVDSSLIASRIKNAPVHLFNREQALEWLADRQPSLIVTAGAGDIELMRDDIRRAAEQGKGTGPAENKKEKRVR
jgi:UDP-N-acetylmuramate--alanine ligase